MPVSEQLRNHLIVREVLRWDDGMREEYGALKLDLARKGHESIGHYAGAKGDMIKRILEMGRKNKDIVARVEEIIRD